MAGQYELGDLGGVLGGDLYSSLFGSMGFDNNAGNPWANQEGFNEGSNAQWGFTPTDEAMGAFDDYSFNWNPEGGNNAGTLTAFDPSGKSYGTYKQKDEDAFTKLMNTVAPMAATWALGGPLSNMFGGGALGGAMGQGLASGFVSAGQGGKFGQGFLSGAVGGGLNGLGAGTPGVMGNNPSAYVAGTPGTSVAGLSGITNPTLAGMVNRGAGSALGSLASGASGSDALKSGLTGAALSGINSAGKNAMDFFGDSMKSWLAPEATGSEADYSMGDISYGSNYNAPGQSALRMAGIYPEMSNVPPSSSNFSDINSIGLPSLGENIYSNASYGEQGYRPVGANVLETAGLRDGMSYAAPGTSGDVSSNFLGDMGSYGNAPMGQQSIQSSGQSEFNLPSIFGDAGSRMGNFALNNAGDLASMLYGFYNNRKQQKALGQQVSSLQGLYSNNSPYATQLRNTLNAKAAQTGRRSNIAGRETQLQAQLADRAASMAPTLMQLNQARGQLKNSMGSNTLSMLNKMGAFQGLAGLFGGNKGPYNNYSMSQNTGDYNLLGMLEGSR